MGTFHLNTSRSRNFNLSFSKQDHAWKLPQEFLQDLNTQWPPNSARGYQTNLVSKALQGSSNFKHMKRQLLAKLTQLSDLMNRGGKPQVPHVKMPWAVCHVQADPIQVELQTPMLPVPRTTLTRQTQMNDLKVLADDACVFPSLDLYLGDSCLIQMNPYIARKRHLLLQTQHNFFTTIARLQSPSQDRDKKQRVGKLSAAG